MNLNLSNQFLVSVQLQLPQSLLKLEQTCLDFQMNITFLPGQPCAQEIMKVLGRKKVEKLKKVITF